MPVSPKDKRTKDQILRLLDDAMVQEEKLLAEVTTLRSQLEACQKRAEDPRAELAEDAIPSSKVPFRLDFYCNAKDKLLKGIIEHLPSRQMRNFEGDGKEMIAEFVAQFLPLDKASKPKAERLPEIIPNPVAEIPAALTVATEPAPLLLPPLSRRPVEPNPIPMGEKRSSRLLRRIHGEFLGQFPDLQAQKQPAAVV